METIQGKTTRQIQRADLVQRTAGYQKVLIDLGTGDGRFAIHTARKEPGWFAVGVDACRENLVALSRTAPQNSLFVIASAQNLPVELHSMADRLTINFPWGSLLTGLLDGDPALMGGLRSAIRPDGDLQVRLNASAMAEAGWALDAGAEQVVQILARAGFRMRPLQQIGSKDLRACATTWARRLAFGRDPRAYVIIGKQGRAYQAEDWRFLQAVQAARLPVTGMPAARTASEASSPLGT